VLTKCIYYPHIFRRSIIFVCAHEVYPSQTKILEGLTKEEIRILNEALFKGVSTRFGLLTIEEYIENPDFIFCQSFHNLRLGSIKFTPPKRRFTPPKRRFWKSEQTFQNAFPRGSTFQGCEYSIWATKRWKVLRKCGLKCLFGLPKSSFGKHKIWEGRTNLSECVFESTFQGREYSILSTNR
jgi:hypothetical protein